MDERKSSFQPVVDPGVRVLILGSLPGEQSLALQRYYGNPRNQFWRLISAVIDFDLVPLDYDERLQALLASHVGLWDTVETASRRGSLDGAIKNSIHNDLTSLTGALPELRAIGFNGGKSASIGLAQLAGRSDLALLTLPSSSPAYTRPYESKLAEWGRLRQFLGH